MRGPLLTRAKTASAALFVTALVLAAPALAAPGAIDRSFGHRGKLRLHFPGFKAREASIATTPGGAIVVAATGDGFSGGPGIAVARLHPNGSLDRSFSGDGRKVIAAEGVDLPSLAVTSGGKILVGARMPANTFVMSRLTRRGKFDRTFGHRGLVSYGVHQFTGSTELVQPNGKIVVSGATHAHGFHAWAIARFNSHGTLDPRFGADGLKLIRLGGDLGDRATGIVRERRGHLLVAGVDDGADPIMAVARLKRDGALDRAFGYKGVGEVAPSDAEYPSGIGLQRGGRIVLGGGAAGGLGFAGLTLGGAVDKSFGDGGTRYVPVGDDFAGGFVLQRDGRAVVASYTYPGSGPPDLRVARVNRDGSVDSAFGDNGVAKAHLSGHAYSASLELQRGGGLVVGAANLKSEDVSIVRFDGR